MHQEQIPFAFTFCALAQVAALADKGKLTQMGSNWEYPVPESQFYADATGLNPQQLNFPLVVAMFIKKYLPKITGFPPVFCRSRRCTINGGITQTALFKSAFFMVQEFIPGAGAGVFALYNQGLAVAFFAHKRL